MTNNGGIREEFEKAFAQYCGSNERPEKSLHRATALWAARWMAEKSAVAIEEKFDGFNNFHPGAMASASTIRQLAKELE